MIDTIIRYQNILSPNKTEEFFFLLLPHTVDVRYFLDISISTEKQVGCEIVIRDKDKKIILENKFFNTCKIPFTTERSEPSQEGLIFANLQLKLLNFENPVFFFLEIIEIQDFFIEPLKCSEERKNDLKKIINSYLKPESDDYTGGIEKICIFGEYLAKEFAKKAKGKSFKEYRAAVNALCNHKMSKRSKINYPYIGSLLWPLYYVRNQKLHPYSIIIFNRRLAETMLSILTQILHYIVDKGFSF